MRSPPNQEVLSGTSNGEPGAGNEMVDEEDPGYPREDLYARSYQVAI